MLTVMLLFSSVSVLLYWYLPVWQVVAAFNVIAVCLGLVLKKTCKEIIEEVLEEEVCTRS